MNADLPYRAEPEPQWFACAVKQCARRQARLMAARGALVKRAAALRPDVIALAEMAARPSVPAGRGKVLATRLFGRKPLLKLTQCLGTTAPQRLVMRLSP